MKLYAISEEEWRAAAQKDGTAGNLVRSFSWKSAVDWPCPVKVKNRHLQAFDKEHSYNGWGAYHEHITGSRFSDGDDGGSEYTELPPEITEYIAMMYVDWKLNGDNDSA